MDNHTTKACGMGEHAESDMNTSRNDKQACCLCGFTGHFKADGICFKPAWDQPNIVNKGTGSTSLVTAEDCDLI
jgi:hypothetical protein